MLKREVKGFFEEFESAEGKEQADIAAAPGRGGNNHQFSGRRKWSRQIVRTVSDSLQMCPLVPV
jgi:hypothetical protein